MKIIKSILTVILLAILNTNCYSQESDSVKIKADTIAKKQLWVATYTGVRWRSPITLYLFSDSTYSLFESNHTGYNFKETGKYSLKNSNIRLRSLYYTEGYWKNTKKRFRYKNKSYQIKDNIIYLYNKNKEKKLEDDEKIKLRKSDWYKINN